MVILRKFRLASCVCFLLSVFCALQFCRCSHAATAFELLPDAKSLWAQPAFGLVAVARSLWAESAFGLVAAAKSPRAEKSFRAVLARSVVNHSMSWLLRMKICVFPLQSLQLLVAGVLFDPEGKHEHVAGT